MQTLDDGADREQLLVADVEQEFGGVVHDGMMNVSLYLPIWISSPSASVDAVAAPPIDVGAVEAAFVDDDPLVAGALDERVVARHGDVVEEDGSVRVAADRDAFAVQRVGLAGAAAAAAHDQAGFVAGERRRARWARPLRRRGDSSCVVADSG